MEPVIYLLSNLVHVVLFMAVVVIALTWRPCQSRVFLFLAAILQVVAHALWFALQTFQRFASVEVPPGVIRLSSLTSLGASLLGAALLVVFAVTMKSELGALKPEHDEFHFEDEEHPPAPPYPGGR